MARETRIGIALMVLLVGVFGFMVYKKWNSRQPTAIAAAAEATSTTADGGQSTETTPVSSASAPAKADASTTSAAAAAVANSDPFAKLPAKPTVPARQSESVAAFADEPFVRESRMDSTASAPASMASAAPPRQAEPSAGAPTSVFTRNEPVPAEEADPFGESATVADAVPANDGGEAFSHEATAKFDAKPAASAAIAVAPAQSSSADLEDPFGDAAEMVQAKSVPMSNAKQPGVSADGPNPFMEDTFAELEPAETGAGSDDPFAEQQPSASEAASTTAAAAPERLFAEDRNTIPAAGSDESADAEIPSFEMTSRTSPVAERAAPMAQDRSTGRTAYTVVAENDSYWTISKRIYGTPVYFHALAKFNSARIQDPNRLKPGMKVLTPDPQELAARFPNLVSRSASTGSESEAEKFGLAWDAQGQPIYRVDRSDTLSGIAQSHLGRASRWVQIYEMNRKVIPDAKTLKPGTVLRLPADASRVRLVPEG